ncbi:MAG: hypothetical protein WD768_15395 [Phycisphaeraceae bacterium]
MTTAPTQREQQLRQAAVAAALLRHGDGAGRLLALHPSGKELKDRLTTEGSHPTLADLFWAELPLIETAAGLRSPKSGERDSSARRPLDYWRRRYRAAFGEEWRWLLAELPSLWRVLIDLSSASVEELAIVLGLEILAQASAGQKLEQVAQVVSSLDEACARQVLTRVRELTGNASLPADVAQAWDALVRRTMKKRTGTKLLRWLALTLLANLLEGMPDERLRVAATRHCRSDLFNVLALGGRAQLVAAQHQKAIEAMVLDVLGRLRPGQDSSSGPGA